MMFADLIELINQGVFAGLLALGAYLVLMNIRTLLLPHRTGTLIGFGFKDANSETVMDMLQKRTCNACSLTGASDGRMTFPVQVNVAGRVETAEVSPCTLCMEQLKVGDMVGITEVGSRKIIQKAGFLSSLPGCPR